MRKSGYETVRSLRTRTPQQRGGSAKVDDGLTRQGPTMAALADDYLDRLRIVNRSPQAIATFRAQIRPFLVWAEERGLVYPVEITWTILESYQRALYAYRKKNGKPLGITTQQGRLCCIRKLFGWLCKRHVLEANPASEIELPRPGKRLPVEPLSIAEVEAVLSQPKIEDLLGIRDRAILELFYSTGIRRAEMARLEVSNLNREKSLLHVRQGKGRKDRVVPVGSRALRWVEKYLDDVRPLLLVRSEEQSLFLTGYGEAFNNDVLSRRVIEYFRMAGISRKAGPHLLRHTCATHLLEGGADIRYIQQLLGHEKLETTAIYTEVSIVQLQAVHARCHPAERPRARATAVPEPNPAHDVAPGSAICPQ